MNMNRWFATAALAGTLSTGAMAGPVLWIGDSDGTLGTVDVATGNATVVGQMTEVMTDIAFDPSGSLWGITFGQLFRIDTTTAAITLVGNLGATLNSLVFAADGTLYAASSSLFSVNTSTGAATLIGGSGYSSSGDLAFVGGGLFLSSASPVSDTLFRLNAATGAGAAIGAIGSSAVYGLASDTNVNLYGVTGTNVLSINAATGAGTFLVNYSGTNLGDAWGSAFRSESGNVPEPATLALLGLGLAGLAASPRRKS